MSLACYTFRKRTFMDHTLLYAVSALAISVVLNIILKKIGVSQVIGYILTGTIIVYAFDLRHMNDSHTLEQIAEFGIVFLMFTIGLELSLPRLGALKQIVFANGILQVTATAAIVFVLADRLLDVPLTSSIIIASAFALSSTAVVLSYLKSSKEIYLPYGQRTMGILIFQDIAVIPILLLIGFLASEGNDWQSTLLHTAESAVLILVVLFYVGRPLMSWLLHFAADSGIEELFLGSVLVIAVGASLLADAMGFTYSLGAFLAGVIIAETNYHHKVEADIASFKDLLLGVFFVTVGMKIDLAFFIHHLPSILGILAAVMLLKSLIIFSLIRLSSPTPIALKTALALSQLGEFSFAIFALAASDGLLDPSLEQYLIMMVVVSLLITPFYLPKVHPFILSRFRQKGLHDDLGTVAERRDHIIVCGYSTVGKFVAAGLKSRGMDYVVIDNSLKHVKEGLKKGEAIYFGDLSKPAIAEALHTENASAVVITLDNPEKKSLICETVLASNPQANLVVKIVTLEEKTALERLHVGHIVDGKHEVAKVLVEQAMLCEMRSKEGPPEKRRGINRAARGL
jgi:monovalent cation:H+ antiporter-2, CPA2 family